LSRPQNDSVPIVVRYTEISPNDDLATSATIPVGTRSSRSTPRRRGGRHPSILHLDRRSSNSSYRRRRPRAPCLPHSPSHSVLSSHLHSSTQNLSDPPPASNETYLAHLLSHNSLGPAQDPSGGWVSLDPACTMAQAHRAAASRSRPHSKQSSNFRLAWRSAKVAA
jgi:hypothetical protein